MKPHPPVMVPSRARRGGHPLPRHSGKTLIRTKPPLRREPEIPDYLPNLAQIADLLGRSTAWARDLKQREPRFPKRTPQGWPLFAFVALLELRRLERLTDEAFNRERAEGAREELAEIEAGHRPELGDFLARFTDIMRDMAAGRLDFDADTGRPSREVHIEEWAEALARFQELPAPGK